MEDLKVLASSISQIAEEKGISYDTILEVIEQALAAAYKKDNDRRGENIQAKLDPKTGKVKLWQVLEVVDDSMIYSEEELEELKNSFEEKTEKEIPEEEDKKVRFNPKKHIMLKDAKEEKPKIKAGEELVINLKTEEGYGRIAAQTAKQVILQRLKEAERNAILDEYKSKEGEVVSGIVQRLEGTNVFFDIGKALGILVPAEQIPGEIYSVGQRFRLYLTSVESGSRGPTIVLSRSYPKFVTKLFEIEVPEVSAGQVEIKSIAREAGFRTKIAVASTEEGIDPIGAMVGQRGTRVMAVINGLGGEKVDIIQWSDDPDEFISNALAPAKISEVKVEEKGKATAIVPEDQLSLAIGKGGQNVRLAARLTGWKIDVKAEGAKDAEEIEEEGIEEEGIEEEPSKKTKGKDKENKKVKKEAKKEAKEKTKEKKVSKKEVKKKTKKVKE
ncbi:MAG: transcription termination factor NusA [Patescibacteria group bacterium]|nr:transcription termination factor NusA [Patescibacteria group bacterium]